MLSFFYRMEYDVKEAESMSKDKGKDKGQQKKKKKEIKKVAAV